MERIFSHAMTQSLYRAAKRVLEKGASPEILRRPLAALEEMVAFRESALGQKILELARQLHINSECDIDIDDATVVYHNGEDGYWVMGWCYVSAPEAEQEEEAKEETSGTDANPSSTAN